MSAHHQMSPSDAKKNIVNKRGCCILHVFAANLGKLDECSAKYQIECAFFADRHHFDNPVYSTSFTGPNRSAGSGQAPTSQISQSTHLPLNNGCSRVVNHFAVPSCSTKKHVNIEREKLAGPSHVLSASAGACANHYQDDTEEEEHESGKYIRRGAMPFREIF